MLFLNLLLSAVSIHPFHFLLFFLLYYFFPDFGFPVSFYLGSRKEMDLLCFITSCCHLVVCWGPQRLQQTPVQNYWNTWKHISMLSGQESKLSHLVTFVPSPKAPFLLPATKAVISSWKAACFVPKFSAENCKCKTNFPHRPMAWWRLLELVSWIFKNWWNVQIILICIWKAEKQREIPMSWFIPQTQCLLHSVLGQDESAHWSSLEETACWRLQNLNQVFHSTFFSFFCYSHNLFLSIHLYKKDQWSSLWQHTC